MTRPTRRTPAQIAQDDLAKAQGKTAAGRKRIERAEAELAAAKAALATLEAHEQYAEQHPDLPEELRTELAEKRAARPLTGPEIDALADADD
jgi:hypothetical protein